MGAIVCLGIAGGGGPMPAAEQWLRLESEDVTMLTDASPKDALGFAVGYSAFRHVFNTLLAPVGHKPPPTQLILFRKHSALAKYCGNERNSRTELLTLTTEIDGRALVAFSLEDGRTEALQRAFEFETIWGLRRVGLMLPLWMSQGAGEVLSTLRIEKGKCVIGLRRDNFDDVLVIRPWQPWPEFSVVTPASAGYYAKGPACSFHAQAWGVMHWVLLAKPDAARERFAALARQTHEMGRADDALSAVFAIAPLEVKDAIRRHVRGGGRTEIPFDAEIERTRLVVTKARMAEVHVRLNDLLRAVGRASDADVELERAREVATDDPLVKEASARRAVLANKTDEAIALYREAIAAGSTNPWAFLISAIGWLDWASVGGEGSEGQGGEGADKAIREIRRALLLDPGNDEAYPALGRAFFMAERFTAENLEELTPGLTAPATGPSVRYFRAMLERRLGKTADCLADLQRVAEHPESRPPLISSAREQIDVTHFLTTQREVNSLVQQKKYREALRCIDEVTRPDLSRSAGDRFTALRAWVDETAKQADLAPVGDAGKSNDFRRSAEGFLKEHPNSPEAEAIRQALERGPLPAENKASE